MKWCWIWKVPKHLNIPRLHKYRSTSSYTVVGALRSPFIPQSTALYISMPWAEIFLQELELCCHRYIYIYHTNPVSPPTIHFKHLQTLLSCHQSWDLCISSTAALCSSCASSQPPSVSPQDINDRSCTPQLPRAARISRRKAAWPLGSSPKRFAEIWEEGRRCATSRKTNCTKLTSWQCSLQGFHESVWVYVLLGDFKPSQRPQQW